MKRAHLTKANSRPPFAPVAHTDDPDDEPRAWALKWSVAALGFAAPGVPVDNLSYSTHPQRG